MTLGDVVGVSLAWFFLTMIFYVCTDEKWVPIFAMIMYVLVGAMAIIAKLNLQGEIYDSRNSNSKYDLGVLYIDVLHGKGLYNDSIVFVSFVWHNACVH